MQQFLRELLDDRSIQVGHPGGQVWAVKGARHSVLATATWGTGRYPAPQLAQAILEQRAITVHDTIQADDVERTVLNPDATLAAQEKAAEMGERFSDNRGRSRPNSCHRCRPENHRPVRREYL